MADPASSRLASTGAVDDFRQLLRPGSIRAVFQPIVRLTDLEPIGYEGLARFPTPPGLIALPPDVTLAAAARQGVRDDLEVACWAAISAAGAPPEGRLLFVNVAPEALRHPGLLRMAEDLPARLVIELTEQDAVQNTTQLRERLRAWISRGALVAVDDAGAGFTSLEYVAEIRPDFLKLSRGMVTGVDRDPSRQAVLRATVAFAREVGARVIAEGVERPEELGGVAAVSTPQMLARTAVRLAALDDPEDIVRETVAAARRLAGFESAMLARADGHGGLYVHHAEGSFAVALSQLDAAELEQIARWVDTGTSSYTAGDTAGRGFVGHEVLREAGANSLIVLPLTAAARSYGLLLLADRANHRTTTEEAELLELLATQAAGSLRMAAAVVELRERAARDPLTGLGHHATFHSELPAMRAATPPGRACAVLVADVDGFKAINDSRGHAAGDEVLRSVAGLLRAVAPAHGRAFRIGGDEFAMVFECGGDGDARRVGWELQSQARARLGSTLSIGLAIAARHESEEQVVARADAALYEVKRRGRDGVLVAPGTTSV